MQSLMSVGIEEPFGVDLKKVGKVTKTWVNRHYVL